MVGTSLHGIAYGTVLCRAGHGRGFVRLAARMCSTMPVDDPLPPTCTQKELPDFDVSVHDEVRTIGSHQAHVVIGCALPVRNRRSKVSMALLANILGGPGMNSRLNVLLRERRGLVYSVEAATTHFRDSSMFTVYFGCDHEDRRRCHDIVCRTIEAAAATPMTARAFDGRVVSIWDRYCWQMTILRSG